jgi:DNA-binding NarL/FixJ family response regulator
MNAYVSAAPAYSGAIETISGTAGSRRATRVLVASSDAAQRLTVANSLNARGCIFALVGGVEELPGQLKSGLFDLVVCALPDMDSVELLRVVRRTMPGLPVIVIAHGAGELGTAQLECAAGLKREMFGDSAASRLGTLTLRERQVLSLIVAGRANKVIAYELSISPRTVENHRARVMEKLRVKSVAELVRIALGAEDMQGGGMGKFASANDTGNAHYAPLAAER